MKLSLIIDGLPHEIDTTDPELLAKWIMEIFGRMQEVTPATLIEVRAYPSFLADGNGRWRPDWIADSRIIGRVDQIRTPRELVAALAKQIEDYEALK